MLKIFLGANPVGVFGLQSGEPCKIIRNIRIHHSDAVSVGPVRGHPVLRDCVHRFASDLYFDSEAVLRIDRRMDGSVSVRFGLAYVILEPARDHGPVAVDLAENAVHFRSRLRDDSEAVHVEERREALLLCLQLPPDRVRGLQPILDLGIYAAQRELGLQFKVEFLDDLRGTRRLPPCLLPQCRVVTKN